MHARVTTAEGQPVVEVTVRAPLPVIGLLGPRRTLAVRGHAMVEGEEGRAEAEAPAESDATAEADTRAAAETPAEADAPAEAVPAEGAP